MDYTVLKFICIVRCSSLEGKSSNANNEIRAIFLKLSIFSKFL